MSTDKAKLFDRLGSSQSNQISQAKHESCLLDLPTFNHKNFSLYDRSKILVSISIFCNVLEYKHANSIY